MRLFFHVNENGRIYRDPVGADFKSLADAKADAVKSLIELVGSGQTQQSFIIEAEDDRHKLVFRTAVSVKVADA